MKRLSILGCLTLALGSFALTSSAQANVAGFEFLHGEVITALGTWAQNIYPIGLFLFGIGATLQLLWTGFESAYNPAHGMEQTSILLLKRAIVLLILFGFFELLSGINGQGAFGVVAMFQDIGRQASGLSDLRPTSILAQGIKTFTAFDNALGAFVVIANLTKPIAILLIGFLWLQAACLVWIAVVMALTILEAKVIAIGGYIMFAFTSTEFTINLALGWLTSLFKSGIKLMVLYMLISISKSMLTTWLALLANPVNWGFEMFVSLPVGTLVLALLVWRVPRLFAEFMPQNTAIDLRILYRI
jgi:P-type conjugative transfer protein TrbL